MRNRIKSVIPAVLAALVLTTSGAERADGLSREDKKEVKKMVEGVLYTRIDIPCETGRHAYGTFKSPLVEVAPDGLTSEARTGVNFQANLFSARSAYWALAPNDPVVVDEIDFDDDTIEIELEGTKSADGRDSVIKLVRIRTMDDFKSAFEQAFSRVPLQDAHPDWPADVRAAIGERKLLTGMNKRQVFYVTGSPVSVNKFQEKDKEVEIWSLRQDSGMKMGFWSVKAGQGTGLPSTLRFEDGKLVTSQPGLSEAGLDLGD